MQRLNSETFESFEKLYNCVNTSFEEIRREGEKKLRQPATSIRLHFFLVMSCVFIAWFLDSGRRITISITRILTSREIDSSLFYTFFIILGFAVWVLAISLISGKVFWKARPGLLLLYSVFVLPALPWLVSLLTRSVDIRSELVVYVYWCAISLCFWMLLFGLMWIFSASIPHILFMLLSSFSKGSDDALIPGYIAMVQRAARVVAEKKVCTNLKAHEWQQIETIVRWKFDGINGRLQAFSLGVGALGLSGILALLFSQEEIRSWFRTFEELMKMLGGGVIVEDGVSVVLVLVMVGIAFLLAAIYFARSYTELRVLEAMGIICSLAASGVGVQQHSE